jgi:hypothetical protein
MVILLNGLNYGLFEKKKNLFSFLAKKMPLGQRLLHNLKLWCEKFWKKRRLAQYSP